MEVSLRFYVSEFVFAKIKGFISEIEGYRAKVVYFNWRNQFNWIGLKKLLRVSAANEIVERYYKKNITFRGAIG